MEAPNPERDKKLVEFFDNLDKLDTSTRNLVRKLVAEANQENFQAVLRRTCGPSLNARVYDKLLANGILK